MITVSILVPIYGVEKYIERCVTSLMEQTYPSIEYIFVDDASPDRSMELLHKTIKKYPAREGQVRILTNKTNRNLSFVRNTSIAHATGDFVFFVDSDDYIEPNTIELMVKRLKATGADLVIGNHWHDDGNSERTVTHPHYNEWKDLVISMMGINNYHSVWNKLIRRSLFEDYHIRVAEGCDFGEDVLIMTQVAYYCHHFTQLDAFTYHYNGANTTSYCGKAIKQFTEEMAVKMMRTASENKAFFKEKEDIFFQKSAILEFHFFFHCLSRLCQCGHKVSFRRISKRFYPSDMRLWPLPFGQKPIYHLALSHYHVMALLLKIKMKIRDNHALNMLVISSRNE